MKALIVLVSMILPLSSHAEDETRLLFDGGKFEAHLYWLAKPNLRDEAKLVVEWRDTTTGAPSDGPGPFGIEFSHAGARVRSEARMVYWGLGKDDLPDHVYEFSGMYFFAPTDDYELRVVVKGYPNDEVQTWKISVDY